MQRAIERKNRSSLRVTVLAMLLVGFVTFCDRPVHAQQSADRSEMLEAARNAGSEASNEEFGAAPGRPDLDLGSTEINLLELLIRGGYLMYPIGFMSLLVVTFGMERLLGLRRRRVLPSPLVHRLRGMIDSRGPVPLGTVRQLCDHYPSSASNVIRSALRKAGRPVIEIEHTVREACEREASRLYANVRWLSLSAGVAPLLGLLGTVWGMIQAFFATANLPAGANKADYLAEGIYVALVTTFAGLAVAIPAGVLAHMFEGRIQRLFRNMNELIEDLLPHLENRETETASEPPDAPAGDGRDGRGSTAPHASNSNRPGAPPVISRPAN